MQPTSQGRAVGELSRILGQCNKDGLRHVLGGVGVANHPQRGGINQINIAVDDGGKRGFGLPLGVVAQELLVGSIVHSVNSTRRLGIPTEIVAGSIRACRQEFPSTVELKQLRDLHIELKVKQPTPAPAPKA